MKLSHRVLHLLALLLTFVPPSIGSSGATMNSAAAELEETKEKRNLRPLPLPYEKSGIIAPRAAPAEVSEIPRSYSAQHQQYKRRRLNVDCINTAVAALLPTINALMQDQIPDPIPIDQTTTQTFTDSSTCGGNTIDCNYLTTEFTGGKSTEITTLQVIEGTETFTCGSPCTFAGDFNFVTSGDTFAVTGTGALSATSCTTYSTAYTGSVINPVFSGTVYLAGTICVNTASLTGYEIKSISATCDSTSTSLTTSVTSEFSNVATTFQNDIGSDYKNYLSTTILTIMTNAINTALSNVRIIPLGFGGGIPIILDFYRASVEQQAQSVLGWINGATTTSKNFFS